MTNLINLADSFFHLNKFDVLFRDLFDSDMAFNSMIDVKPNYPVDIKETKDGLEIDIAAIGLDKKAIKLQIEDNDTLIVEYKKQNETESDARYLCRGITRKAFRFAWKIAPKFNINAIKAEMENGLLQLKIPVSPEASPKLIDIK